MSLVKKSDVKNHLSSHHKRAIHLNPPVSQPDATGFSEEESPRTDLDKEEQIQQPTSTGPEASSLVNSADSGSSVAPPSPKSAQA